MTQQRAQFATRLGVIATTVGSAVGLGNIWRFPFEAGVHGGGAFLLIDLFFIFIIGVPVVCAEFIIGRHTGLNVRGAFRKLAPGRPWGIVGYLGLLASILILSFYSVVAGWTLEYIWQSLNSFGGVTSVEGLHGQFDSFATSDWRPAMWTIVFLAINYLILARGVQKGIEKMSNIMMPLLFVILVVFCINSLRMPAAAEGLTFLFKPDFSQVTPSVMLGAMGQAFFSLSLGLGCLITYSSYFKKETPLLRTAGIMASLDTMVAILAGVIIFPAVFTFGMEPAAGPKLVFEILPSIFMHMPGSMMWSVLFFILLFLASLSSTISMSEITIAYMTDEYGFSRRRATAYNIGVAMLLGSVCALSFGSLSRWTVCGLTVFNLFDYVSSNIILPVGGMIISIFVGWVLDRTVVTSELMTPGSGVKPWMVKAVVICLRYIAPTCIGLVFVCGLGLW
ncbi:MAG: sodium-dependent transporter [Duncaniella sp.]|uniref:sodium-dependent transporter n=1 Tax=Duncaniella sp. TaxID=2518496 RepID=UPI0023D5291B|nr:sodium-dependent transporter [Duncaniella sp.]MDE6089573.1 sodium-dependent transporter [Duncaniella sp.]